MIELAKEFMMCPHPLFLEASLDKEVCIIKSNLIIFFADIRVLPSNILNKLWLRDLVFPN